MDRILDNGSVIKGQIIENIRKAATDIKLAMAFFTDKEIFAEITEANRRSVKIYIVLSNDLMNQQIFDLSKVYLSDSFRLFARPSQDRGIMHHKFCIIDSSIILKGSYNYTINASRHNNESLEITDNLNIVREYESIFERLISGLEEIKPMSLPKLNGLNSQPDDNSQDEIEQYSNRLQNLISDLVDKFDHDGQITEGYESSKLTLGEPENFKTSLDLILNEYKINLVNDVNSRNNIKTRLNVAMTEKTNQLEKNQELSVKNIEEIYNQKIEESNVQIKKEVDAIDQLQKEKNDAEAGLKKEQLNLETANHEINLVSTQIGTTPFTFKNTWYNFLFLLILFVYLFIFYSSAIYNLVYVAKEAERAANIGGELPRVDFFNSKALGAIWASGWSDILFNFMAVFIPLGLAISKTYNKNRALNFILGWIIAVLIVDFFVAVSISKTVSQVNSLRLGIEDDWTLLGSFSNLEFWKVFIFGAIPLIMFKLFAELIYSKWRASKADIMNKEKSIQLKILKQQKIDIGQKIHNHEFNIRRIGDGIDALKSNISVFENGISEFRGNAQRELNRLNDYCNKKIAAIQEVTTNFIADIDTGNIASLRDVITARIAAYKKGYINFITSYYAENESQRRIKLINKVYEEWNQEKF